jgi:hypothetical protein
VAQRTLPADHPLIKDYRDTLARCRSAISRNAKP